MLPLHEDSRTGSISKQVLNPESVTDTTYYHPSSHFSFCAFRTVQGWHGLRKTVVKPIFSGFCEVINHK